MREVVPLVEPIDLAMYVIKSETQTTLDKWGTKRQLSQELKDALRNLARIRDNDRYDADGDPHGAYHDLDSHFYRKETKESREFWEKWDEIPEHVKYHNLEEGHPLRPSKYDVGLEYRDIVRREQDLFPYFSDWTFSYEDYNHPKYGLPVDEEELREYLESDEFNPHNVKNKRNTVNWMNDYHRKHGRYEHISNDLPGEGDYEETKHERNPKLTVQEMVEGPAKGESYQSTLPMHDWSLDKFSGWKGVDPVVAYRENPGWSNLMASKRGLQARPMTGESIDWDEGHDTELRHTYKNWKKKKSKTIASIEDDIKFWKGQTIAGESTGAVLDDLYADLDKHEAELFDENDEEIPMEENAAFHDWNVKNRKKGDNSAYLHGTVEGAVDNGGLRSVRRQKFHHQGRRGNFVYPPNTRNHDGKFLRDINHTPIDAQLSRNPITSRRYLDEPIIPFELKTTDQIGIRGDPFKMRGQFANLGLGSERAEAFLEEDIPRENLVFGGLPQWMTKKKRLEEGETTDSNQWPHMNFDMVDALNAQGVSSGAPIVGWEQDGANFHFKDVMGNIVHSMTADEAREYAGDERGWVNEAV